jgi:GxxExxY protein
MKMKESELDQITKKIIGCMYKASNALGCGFVEKVYQNSAVIEIRQSGLRAQQQFPIRVKYGGVIVGEFFADILVEELVLVELKVVRLLDQVHIAQCLNYLRATELPVCLLVNFYRPKVEIRRIIPNDAWRAGKN